MRGFFALVGCSAALMIGGMAVAKDKAPADPNRKICHPVQDSTSRLARQKICKTAEEWKRDSENSTVQDNEIRRLSERSGH